MRGPFENRDFRRLFAGRVVTNVGDSLYFVAAMWLVYSLTGDAFYSGVAGFLTLAPSALQFLGGPLVDRWSIRRTLTGTQAVQAVLVAVVQSAPPEEYVGRVSSVFGSASAASIPVGSLAGGAAASTFSPRAATFGLGVGTVGLAVSVLALPGLRDLPAPDRIALRPGSH